MKYQQYKLLVPSNMNTSPMWLSKGGKDMIYTNECSIVIEPSTPPYSVEIDSPHNYDYDDENSIWKKMHFTQTTDETFL
jgi:hypothetical protein